MFLVDQKAAVGDMNMKEALLFVLLVCRNEIHTSFIESGKVISPCNISAAVLCTCRVSRQGNGSHNVKQLVLNLFVVYHLALNIVNLNHTRLHLLGDVTMVTCSLVSENELNDFHKTVVLR